MSVALRIVPICLAVCMLTPWTAFANDASRGDGALPDCSSGRPGQLNICKVPFPEDAVKVGKRLGGNDEFWWREGSRFNLVARRKAEDVTLCCAIQAPLTRLPQTDLWVLSVDIQRLDEAVLDIVIFDGGDQPSLGEWRGPKAPADPITAQVSSGKVETVEVESARLGIKRRISVYQPAGYVQGRVYPVIYMADGEGVEAYAPSLDSAVAAGDIPPVVVIGIWNAGGRDQAARSKEQLVGFEGGHAAFEAFQHYFKDEVVSVAEARFGASPDPRRRVVAGASNGAAWALQTAARDPKQFPNVISLANGWTPSLSTAPSSLSGLRVFAEAGTFESHASQLAVQIVDRVNEAGGSALFYQPVSGHTSIVWAQALPLAVKYTLSGGEIR